MYVVAWQCIQILHSASFACAGETSTLSKTILREKSPLFMLIWQSWWEWILVLAWEKQRREKMFNMTVSLHMVKKLLIRNFSNLANKVPFSVYNFGFFIGPFIDIVSKCKILRDGVSGQIMFAVWFSAQAEMKRWKWPFCTFDHGFEFSRAMAIAAVEISIISFDLDTLFQLEQMMFHCVLLRPFLNDSTAARELAEHLPLSELSDPHIILLRLMSQNFLVHWTSMLNIFTNWCIHFEMNFISLKEVLQIVKFVLSNKKWLGF